MLLEQLKMLKIQANKRERDYDAEKERINKELDDVKSLIMTGKLPS